MAFLRPPYTGLIYPGGPQDWGAKKCMPFRDALRRPAPVYNKVKIAATEQRRKTVKSFLGSPSAREPRASSIQHGSVRTNPLSRNGVHTFPSCVPHNHLETKLARQMVRHLYLKNFNMQLHSGIIPVRELCLIKLQFSAPSHGLVLSARGFYGRNVCECRMGGDKKQGASWEDNSIHCRNYSTEN